MKTEWPSNFTRTFRNFHTQFRDGETGSLIKRITIFGIGTFVAQGFLIVNAILLARHFAPNDYGSLVGVFSISSLTSFVFNWGFDTWLLRHAAIDNEPKLLSGTVLSLKTLLAFFWLVPLTTIVPSVSPQVFPQNLLIIAAIDTWIESLLKTVNASLNAQEKSTQASMLILMARALRLAGTIWLITIDRLALLEFASLRLITTAISVFVCLIILRPVFKFQPISNYTTIWRKSIPYALSDLLSLIYLQMDVTLLGLMLRSSLEMGLYSPASGLINALFVIPIAGYTVLIPTLTKLASRKRLSVLHIGLLFLGFGIIGILLWIGSATFGADLTIRLLGVSYRATGEFLSGLSPILLLKSISFAGATIIVAVGWQRKRLVFQGIGAVINLLVNLVLIPTRGASGAVVAYIVSEALLMLGYVWLTRQWIFTRRTTIQDTIDYRDNE